MNTILKIIVFICGVAFFVQAYRDKRFRGQENYRSWKQIFHGENKFSGDSANNEPKPNITPLTPPAATPISGPVGIVLPAIFLTKDYHNLNDEETDEFLDEAMADLDQQGLNTSDWTYDQAVMVFNALMKHDEIDPELLQDPNEFDALEDDIEIQRREIEHEDYPGDEDDKDFDLAGKSIDGTDYDNWNHTDAEDNDDDEYTKYYSDR